MCISLKDYWALAACKSVEEFIVTKELFGISRRLNAIDSYELAATFIAQRKANIAYGLLKHDVFTVDDDFIKFNEVEKRGRPEYINDGMRIFIAKSIRHEN